jgi:NAD(P)H-dependent FMN reductase
MAAANNNDVEILWIKHGIDYECGRRSKARARRFGGKVRFYRAVVNLVTIKGMKLLIFAGSTRQNSFNRQLAATAAAMARDTGAEVTHLELATLDIPLYNADLEARGTPPDVMRLKKLMLDHPAWIICSPEYNGSYTALLKNTLDWASSPVKGNPAWSQGTEAFDGKVVGLLSASPGALGGLRSLSHLSPLLLNLQCWVAPQQFALGSAAQAFDAHGVMRGEAARQGVQAVVDQVLWASTCLNNKIAL